MKKILILGSLITLATPMVVFSCSSNDSHHKASLTDPKDEHHKPASIDHDEHSSDPISIKGDSSGSYFILNKDEYNNLYDEMPKERKDVVALAIIANHKLYKDIVTIHSGETVEDVLDDSIFDFKKDTSSSMGSFINSFRLKGTSNWLHGTNKNQNYGDYYPMYYINHVFATLGVSSNHIVGREVLEFTYDV